MSVSEQVAVRRLRQRLGLGPRPGEPDAAFAPTLDALLGAAPDTAPTPAFPEVADPATNDSAAKNNSATKNDTAAKKAARQQRAEQARQLTVWWLDRMATTTAPFPERLTWFWHGHFATSVQKVRSAALMAGQNATQRRLGGGDFRALAAAMIVDPAMLIWLDGRGSSVGKPNENLAREYMELFTLGVGHYSEDDVRQAARALTGWTVNADGTATFRPPRHDPGPETVLGDTAPFDAPGLADLLTGRPESAAFLAGRVWARFVSDTPPDPATLDGLVAAYGPQRNVTALVRAAVSAPAFTDPASVLVREPVLWLVGALRALGLPASRVPAAALRSGIRGLGQEPFAPPSVGGWPAGTPWLTTAAALERLRLAEALAAAGDLSPVADQPQAQRVDAAAALLGVTWTGRTAAALRPLAARPPQLVAAALASPENTVSA
ncbi:DUF1800 domain-containing protein [Pseudonocardia ailaonensis]|uniref:DUF1800 domain-containing protein n=1 Tax=Pseudonocardia ailaonensis TaxID=367279 RepID=A0ABN2MU28_9PSEU